MKYPIFILGFFFAFQSNAQDYVPFPTDSATWIESTQFVGYGFDAWIQNQAFISGDTLEQDTLYKKVYFHRQGGFFSDGTVYAGGLRESIDKKIYFRPSIWCTDSGDLSLIEFGLFPEANVEYLIYDFDNVVIGDTLHGTERVVESIDSILVGDDYRKIYQFNEESSLWFQESYVIEGIGSSIGLLGYFKEQDNLGYNSSMLSCFHDGEEEFVNPFHFEVLNCQVGTSVEEHSENRFSIYPNPTKNHLTLESSSRISEVMVFNPLGELVMSEKVSGLRFIINTTDFETGLYMVSVKLDNGEFVIERFIRN